MANAIDCHTFGSIVDGEENPVIADSKPIAGDAGQLLDLSMARLEGKLLSSMENGLTLWFWNVAQVFLDALVVEKGVRALEEPLALQAFGELRMGECGAAGTHGTLQLHSIFEVFDQTNELFVVHD